MKLILWLNQLGKNDVSIAGGKGVSLGEMIKIDIPVPPGFVILSSAFEKFLEETGLNVEIDSIFHSISYKKIYTIENASEK
jgi:pyruvate,water dikinase